MKPSNGRYCFLSTALVAAVITASSWSLTLHDRSMRADAELKRHLHDQLEFADIRDALLERYEKVIDGEGKIDAEAAVKSVREILEEHKAEARIRRTKVMEQIRSVQAE